MEVVAAGALMERLIKLLRDDVQLIPGIEEDVEMLVEDLQRLRASARHFSMKNEQLRILVYRTEDSIDRFVVEVKRHMVKPLAARIFDVSYLLAVGDVAREIQSTRNKVKEFCDITIREGATIMDKTTPLQRERVLLDEDDVVGLYEETNIVINRLIEGSTDLEVVPITGMAGLGKSTLARKVYMDSSITTGFSDRIWVGVYQTHTKEDVLLKILANFTRVTNEYRTMNKGQLTNSIRTFLEKRGRCLLVLDDVWDKDIVNSIKYIFPNNNKSHRIMLTTRLVDVASSLSEDIHIINFLSEANSRLLLEKKVFKKRTFPTELKEIGKSIAKKCNGIPLAIVVTARALECCNTKGEWQLVDQNIDTVLMNRDDPYSCFGSVKMSYDQLPHYQKLCFLYCAAFPVGFDIPAWKLIRLWIVEGFIISSSTRISLEKKAEYCLDDLTRKNLVLVMTRKSDGCIKTCRIHDMVYEFCRKEANEEGLFQKIRFARNRSLQMTIDSHNCRRLSIDNSCLSDFITSKKHMDLELVRSFVCFSSGYIQMHPSDMRTISKAFPLIRVLNVESINFTNIYSKDFFRLLHLRYVSFSGNFDVLPEAFGKFLDLETLIINTTTQERTIDIKADIWIMPRLRHFHTNVPAKLPSHSVATSKECLIQTLSVIAPESFTEKLFPSPRTPYLRKLGVQGNVLELLDNSSRALIKLLASSKQLESLKLFCDDHFTDKVISLSTIVKFFPKCLTKLTLSGSRLEWSEMNKVGQLGSLQVLKLKADAFKGDIWEPELGGFTSLLVLWIERTDLKTWKASNGNFPCLKRLVLISCKDLVAVPESLADIPSLQEMDLRNTHNAAIRSARLIERKKLERGTRCFTPGFKLLARIDTE